MDRRNRYNLQSRRTRRGQSLVVAVIVMFVLLFIGGIFVGLVARNLMNSGRARDTISALEFAQGGIRYCDNFLMNSPEGADWRPAPSFAINPQDPDIRWLQGGDWTRVTLNGGRALVRVTFQPTFIPDPADPMGARRILDPLSRRVKIESIGRVGELDPTDPTTFLNTPAPRLRRELVAYKSIGLTDYLFYITNRWRDTKAQANLGVPPVAIRVPAGYSGPAIPLAMEFGKLPVRPGTLPWPVANTTVGASIYSNATLNFMGDARIYANRLLGDSILAAGPITVAPNDASNPALFTNLATGANGPVLPSSSAAFSTYDGLLRDDSPSPDATGHARSVTYLDPPLIDSVDQSTQQTRYRMLTRNSGPRINNMYTGRIGMGEGLYIDNDEDLDNRTGRTFPIRTEWLTPGIDGGRWDGPHYIPRGVFLDFGYPVVQARDADTSELIPDEFIATPGVRIIRDVSDRRWRDPAGRYSSTTELNFTFFIYKPIARRPVLKLECEFFRSALRGAPFNMTEKEIDRFLPEFNGVIFAEGNARVRGLMPARENIPIRRELASEPNAPSDTQIYEMSNAPAVTLVSGDDIYVEGSLIREAPNSMIGLLAQNYVVVNTTMFVAENQAGPFESTSGAGSARVPTHVRIDTEDATRTPPWMLETFHGDNPVLYADVSGASMSQRLMLYHGVPGIQNGITFLNLFVNDWFPRTANSPRYLFRPPSPGDAGDYYMIRSEGSDNGFLRQDFQLNPKPNTSNYLFTGDAGYAWPQGLRDTFRPQLDPNFTQTAGTQPYLLARAAVVPSDMRIEAVMYAQNESFFIIPGMPFNDDPSDTPEVAEQRAVLLGLAAGSLQRPMGTTDFMPFFRDPIDCRITIVGAISQNKTAPIGDQAAWMQQWGYIHEVYGSTGRNPNTSPAEQTIPRQHQFVDEVGLSSADQRTNDERAARVTRGIRFLYDPALMTPFVAYNTAGAANRRDDAYFNPSTNSIKAGNADVGRTLPPLPRLPMSPGFVYYGEVH